jgi:hypothetical protein
MLVGVRAVLAERAPLARGWVKPALTVAAVLFAGGALYSSFLVLRGAEVGPRDHQDELVGLRDEMLGSNALFLGNDDYVYWQLYGVPIAALPATRPQKAFEYGQPYDFDSVAPETIDEAGFTITTRTAYRSEPPPNLRRLRATRSYELWRRHGPTPERRTLREGFEPGATLDCSTRSGRRLAAEPGWAWIWDTPPVFRSLNATTASAIDPGESRDTAIRLGPGRWELSLQYISRRAIEVLWRIGEVEQRRDGRRRIELSVDDDPIGSTNHAALPTGIAAARIDSRRHLVPLREACGRYVDWYALGSARPRV